MNWEKVHFIGCFTARIGREDRIQGLFFSNDVFLNVFYETKNQKLCSLIEGEKGMFLTFGL